MIASNDLLILILVGWATLMVLGAFVFDLIRGRD